MDQQNAKELIDKVESAAEKAGSLILMLMDNGSNLEGFTLSHRRTMGVLWAVDDYLRQIEDNLKLLDLPPPSNDH